MSLSIDFESDYDVDDQSDTDENLEEKSLQHLTENYSNVMSPVAYLGAKKLYYYYDKNISYAKIRDFLSTKESYTLMAPERRSRIFDRTLAFSPNEVLQFDLIQVRELSNYNEGITQIICGIDCYTKEAHVETLLTKHCENVVQQMSNIIYRFGQRPRIISMDRGSEFNCTKTKTFLKNLGIKAFFAQGNYKCAVVERFQATLQRLIYTHLTEHETLKFSDILQDILRLYNSSYNRSIGMTPFEASNPKNKNVLTRNIAKYRIKDRVKKIQPKFSVGDIVRISIQKDKFHRGYNYQNTMVRYIIEKICTRHIQPCYYLKNEKGES
ncbi:MAG TPA: transposase, partial [Flavobacteriaceae bacterium]|nr:transposase [Flavobacteriaceae bacterium]